MYQTLNKCNNYNFTYQQYVLITPDIPVDNYKKTPTITHLLKIFITKSHSKTIYPQASVEDYDYI